MTYEEALEDMKCIASGQGSWQINTKYVFDKVFEALEKQIAKKPVVYNDGNKLHLKAYECNVCGGQLVSEFDGWCRECGQKIDWRGKNDSENQA